MIDVDDIAPAVGKTGLIIVPSWDEGHAEFNWSRDDEKDVEAARVYFTRMKALGYAAYRADPKTGGKGEVLKEFDPKAEKIIMVPPFAGG